MSDQPSPNGVKLRCCICGRRGESEDAEALPYGWEGNPHLQQITLTAVDHETGAVIIFATPICSQRCSEKVAASTRLGSPPPFHPWAQKRAELFGQSASSLVVGQFPTIDLTKKV